VNVYGYTGTLGERDASACMRRHQAFALAPILAHWYATSQQSG